MKKMHWLQLFAEQQPEPDMPETAAPEQAERLAQVPPDGKVPQTQEQREQAMRAGYERLRAQFEQVREAYPQAELAQELDDPAFLRLVVRGGDAKRAYRSFGRALWRMARAAREKS